MTRRAPRALIIGGSLGGLFTVQTRRQGEAYLVASSGKLVGFYLPGELAYLPLNRPVTLPVEKRQ